MVIAEIRKWNKTKKNLIGKNAQHENNRIICKVEKPSTDTCIIFAVALLDSWIKHVNLTVKKELVAYDWLDGNDEVEIWHLYF